MKEEVMTVSKGMESLRQQIDGLSEELEIRK